MYYEDKDEYYCYCGHFIMIIHDDCDGDWRSVLEQNTIEWNFDVIKDTAHMEEVGQWCEDNLKNRWVLGYKSSGFIDSDDALAFKLRWL